MSRYDVYGLGNALVDMQFETSPEELERIGVEKGVMTLVDHNQQARMLEGLGRDPDKRACGGSAANTMIALSQFGGSGYYSCRVAGDATGRFYRSDLKSNGVHTNLDDHPLVGHGEGEAHTGICLVLVTPDADRTMCTHLGITAEISAAELDEAAIAESRWLYMEGYLAPSPTGRAAAIQARTIAEQNSVKTSITLSDPNMVRFFKHEFLDMIGDGVDLLFCNESEALLFAETEDLDEAVAILKNHAGAFAITRGAEGSLAYDGTREIHVPATPVKPLDTNGAGDCFAGTFLYAITHDMDFETAAHLANRTSGRLVQEFGPRLPADLPPGILAEFLAARE